MSRATKQCPEDWKPSDKFRTWAEKNCPNLMGDYWNILAAFKDHTFATSKSDWEATARNWFRKESQHRAPRARAEPAPMPIRNTYVAPPNRDKYEKSASKVFQYVVMQSGGFPQTSPGHSPIVAAMIKRKNELCSDFRLLEAEGEEVKHFPKVVLKEFRRIYKEMA